MIFLIVDFVFLFFNVFLLNFTEIFFINIFLRSDVLNRGITQFEILMSAFFLFLAAIAYGWIGVNFAVDDRKLNKIISPLMLINSIFYLSCIFYAFDFPVIKLIIFLIFSKAFWSIAISPFANKYFKERALFAKLYKLDLIIIIQYAIDNKNLTIDDINNIELTSESSENILRVLNFKVSNDDLIDEKNKIIIDNQNNQNEQ